MQFASPYFLWLLAVIPLMVVYYVWRTRQGGASIQVSTIDGVAEAPRTVRYYLRHLPFALRCAAVALLIVALARPQSVDEGSTSNTEGIDIVLAIDISTSMLAQDLQPDRIQAAKQVAGNFITDRPGDRIGLVAFAGEAFTQSPLTTDQGTLQTLLGRLRSGVVEDGTAIGNGLATAINRLRESNAKSKVIILLTDGVNNRGEIAPLTAAEIAKAQGIRVYTIGVGTEGMAPYPAIDMFGNITFVNQKVEIDEKTLTAISDMTGGKYFRATDKAKLKAIYDEINQLEKSKVEVTEHVSYHELYLAWVLAALGLLLATVGTDPEYGTLRFTFGIIELSDGISLMPMVIGLLAFSEVLLQAENYFRQRLNGKGAMQQVPVSSDPDDNRMTGKEFKMCLPTIGRSTVIGSIVGIVLNAVMPGKDYVYGEDKQGDESVNFIVQ